MSVHTSDRRQWSTWHAAAGWPEIDEALRGLYARLDADIAERGPTCWQSGKCCDFGGYGHRLYVTALEVAWFTRQVSFDGPSEIAEDPANRLSLPQWSSTPDDQICPYMVNRRCTAHTVRPLGCRVFFCQRGTEGWQGELYEDYLAELRALHDAHGVAYRYADWLALLDEAGAAASA